MRIFFNLSLTLFFTTICLAQNNKWVKSKSSDNLVYKTIGLFENSATKNSELGVLGVDEGSGIRFYLYEYGFEGRPEVEFSEGSGISTIGVILNGEHKEYPVYFTPSSLLFKKGTDFYDLIKKGGQEKIKVVVYSWRFNKYNNAMYIFQLKPQ
ncbi:MAG: hypothetical protein ABNH00_08540 [Dokdonia sp.]|jgi:hypothetical protein